MLFSGFIVLASICPVAYRCPNRGGALIRVAARTCWHFLENFSQLVLLSLPKQQAKCSKQRCSGRARKRSFGRSRLARSHASVSLAAVERPDCINAVGRRRRKPVLAARATTKWTAVARHKRGLGYYLLDVRQEGRREGQWTTVEKNGRNS